MSTVIVRDPDGETLAFACSTLDFSEQAVALDRITSGKGRLLAYYFGEGNRAVVLEFGDFRLRGMLRTAWKDGERFWRVQITPVPVEQRDIAVAPVEADAAVVSR